MTKFWIIAGLMIVVALLFIVPPLLVRARRLGSATRTELNLSIYRDQLRELDADLAAGTLSMEQYQIARNELEGRVLDDSGAAANVTTPPSSGRIWAIAAVIAVPIFTISLYSILGKPWELASQHEANQPQEVTQEQINAMVEGLAQKLKENPNDAEGWAMLGRSYVNLRRYAEASTAYARLTALVPNDAQLLADYADVLAMKNSRSMKGEPEKLIIQALTIDPDNIKALALAGTAAFQRKSYNSAIEKWQKLLTLVPADSQIAGQISANISQTQGLIGQPLVAKKKAPAQSEVVNRSVAGGGSVSGKVSLDPKIKAKVEDNDTVFIFARDADAPLRPPLAILRKTAKELPLTFALNDSMAMSPAFKLSSASKVVVGARISKSGNATPSPGDLQGFSQPALIGENGIVITINSEIKQ